MSVVHAPGPAKAVEARLRQPASRHGLVHRSELVMRLLDAHDARVVLLAAGAGFGKTTLLVQWAERDRRPFAWLSLDAGDDDPATLVADVVGALDAAGLDAGPVPLSRPWLAVAAGTRPFVLVLDDAHRLRSAESLRLVATLVANVPPGCHIAIAGRGEPGLPLARWSVQGDLLRFGAEQLAMTHAEASLLLDPERDLDPAALAALVRDTEGWPAGLCMAAGRVREERAAGAFGGHEHLLAAYLGDEVLAPLGADGHRFLTRTAILERLCGPACDAVLGRRDSASTLRRIARVNLFLQPVAGRRGWYRCHPLLRDVLLAELHLREPGLVPVLHQRASAWLEAGGDVGEAIRHARAAGDHRRAGDLVWAGLRPLACRAELEALLRWTEDDGGAIAAHPPLALAAGWRDMERGDGAGALRWAAAAERGPYEGPLPGGPASVAAAAAVLRALVAGDGVARMAADAASGQAGQIPAGTWPAVCALLQGVARRLSGDTRGARVSLAAAERLGLGAADPAILTRALAQQAALAADEDDWPAAGALVARARAASEWRRPSVVARVELGAISALAMARLGQTADSASEARRCRRLLASAAHLPPWLAVDARVQLAGARVLVGDATASRSLLREARALLARMPDAGALGARLEAAWRRTEAFPLAGVVAPAALSSAELRVLRFLPTHLTYREIGERLHVSRCTVKSQALSAYRKLDVSSRSQAVDRAHALGLIRAIGGDDGERP